MTVDQNRKKKLGNLLKNLPLEQRLSQLCTRKATVCATLWENPDTRVISFRDPGSKKFSFSPGGWVFNRVLRSEEPLISKGSEAVWIRMAVRLHGAVVGALELRLEPVHMAPGRVAILAQNLIDEVQSLFLELGITVTSPNWLEGEDLAQAEILQELIERQGEELSIAREKSSMLEFLQDVGTTTEIDFLIRLCPYISRFVGGERTTIWIYDGENDQLRTIYGEGLEGEIILPSHKGLVGQCFTTRRTFFSNDPYKTAGFHKKVDKNTGYRTASSLVSPIRHRGEILGVIQVLNKAPGFDDRDLERIMALGRALTSHLNIYKLVSSHIAATQEVESLLETIPDVIYKIDLEGKIQYMSKRVEFWGYNADNLIGKPISALMSLPEQNAVKDLTDLLLTASEGDMPSTKALEVLIHPGNSLLKQKSQRVEPYYGEVNASAYWFSRPGKPRELTGGIGIIRDITRRKETERKLHAAQQELIQAERFAGLGTLAAGIAHDFNNLLGVIGVGADLLLMSEEMGLKPPVIHSTCEDISTAVSRAADLTQRLLTIAQSTGPHVEPTDIHSTVDDAVKIMERQVRSKGIDLEVKVDPGLPSLYA